MPDVKSLRAQIIASGQAFAKGGSVTARMAGGTPNMQFLAIAGATGAGRQIIEARRAHEERKMREAMVEKEARDRFDRTELLDVNLSQLEKLCRVTIGNALEQLPEAADITALEINRRGGLLVMLLTKLNTLLDLRHDLHLLAQDASMRDLAPRFQDRIHYNAVRYDRSHRSEDVIKNVFQRVQETVEDMRQMERAIRDTLTRYDPMAEWMEDYRRLDEVFEVMVDAHMALEQRAEDQLYALEPA